MSGAAGILVVDDQPKNLTAIETVLAPLGREVVTAGSGEEALRRLLDGDFAVIVMDVRMPGLDGFETVELIKRRPRHADTAVVFLTAADADVDQIRRGYESGAVDYILKPVDPDILRSKVAMLLELGEKNAALRASEERFRTAFEGAPIGMALSTMEGDFVEVNGALCVLIGVPEGEVTGRPLWELVHPADRQAEREQQERIVSEQPRFDQRELRFKRADQRVVHALVSVSLLDGAQDSPLGYIWQVVDVTEQRRSAEERAARAEAEAVADALGKLQQVTEAALEHLDLRELLQQLADRIRDAFSTDFARILLRDSDLEPLLSVGATSGFEPGAAAEPVPIAGVLEQALGEQRAITVVDLPEGAGLDRALAAQRARALMAAPLFVDGRPAGVVEVGTRTERRFGAGDEGLLLLMADRAGLAVEHARKYERELSNVELLQRALLPERLPYVEGVRLAARYLPGAGDVGGDWYDAIPLADGRLGVAMGDVVGHGIGAAALMGQLRHATRAYALEGHQPGIVLDRLDRLVRSLQGGQMATLLYVVVEPGMERLTFASAGHVPPLTIAPDGSTAYLDGAPNPPLGVFDSEAHAELTAELEPGMALVLYTDGLVEERGVSIDAGLEALRRAARPGAPEELCERLLAVKPDLRAAHDDIAILVLGGLTAALEPLHLEVPADPELLGSVRRDLARWLIAGGASTDDVEAVQMACHEACSNAIEHGYAFGEGSFTIDGRFEGGRALLTVQDHGGWVERPNGSLPHRGHGLPLMEALMESVEVERDGERTAVQMARRLAGDRVTTA